MADVFVSYSRRNSDFVGRLRASLDQRGKEVWLDTETIADGEVFPEAIRRAIEESESFVFVITPESVASAYCGQEVDYAGELGKRIVPVLRQAVADDEIPEPIRERNWIPFVDEDAYERSVDRVVTAVDTDLDYRKAHTRWLVKAVEWDREGRDHSFLLRGSELSAAESWLAGAAATADPPPSELQRSYLLASRQANLRRQRRFAVAGVSVAAVSIALLVFALVSRGQAVTAETTASSRALAAQSLNLLSTDPESSVLVATQALHKAPTPDALYATRQALDHLTVRMALPLAKVTNGCYPMALYSSTGRQIVQVTGTGQLQAYDAAGHLTWHEKMKGTADCTLAVDPAAPAAAVAVGTGVDLVSTADGTVQTTLDPSVLVGGTASGNPYTMAYSADGRELAVVTTGGQLELWNLASRSGWLVQLPTSVVQASFTADGARLVLGTTSGTLLVVDPTDGAVVQTVTVGGPTDYVDAVASPTGTTVAVSDFPFSGRPTTLALWSSATWTPQASLTNFGPISVDDMAFSPDGRRLAVGLADGQGSVWSVVTDDELAPLIGQTSSVSAVGFSADGARAIVSAWDGSARVYQSTGPGLGSVQVDSALTPTSMSWTAEGFSGVMESGTGACTPDCEWDTWSWPSGALQSEHVLTTDPNALVSASGPDVAVAAPDSTSGDTWTVTVYQRQPFEVVHTFPHVALGAIGVVSQGFVGLSDGGRHLELALTGGSTRGAQLRTYDVKTGAVLASRYFKTPTGEVCGIDGAVSTRQAHAYALADYCDHVWIIGNAPHSAVLRVDTGGRESAMAFNAGGTQLAIGSWDGLVNVIDPSTGHRDFQLVGNAEGITSLAYSPDGRYIVTTSSNGDVQTWLATDGALLRTQDDTYSPGTVVFTPDGRMATWDGDQTVRLWDVCTDCQDPSALLGLAQRAVVSPLTAAERQQSAHG